MYKQMDGYESDVQRASRERREREESQSLIKRREYNKKLREQGYFRDYYAKMDPEKRTKRTQRTPSYLKLQERKKTLAEGAVIEMVRDKEVVTIAVTIRDQDILDDFATFSPFIARKMNKLVRKDLSNLENGDMTTYQEN